MRILSVHESTSRYRRHRVHTHASSTNDVWSDMMLAMIGVVSAIGLIVSTHHLNQDHESIAQTTTEIAEESDHTPWRSDASSWPTRPPSPPSPQIDTARTIAQTSAATGFQNNSPIIVQTPAATKPPNNSSVIAAPQTTVLVPKVSADSADLWAEYQDNINQHPNIPNVSFAGYAYGERPFPAARVPATDVKRCGARGDGVQDDTDAFEKAIIQANGGDVAIPSGTYRLTRPLRIRQSGVVLRGAGSGSTTLRFQHSLGELYGMDIHDGECKWAWSGGLIWIEPTETNLHPPELPVVGPASAGSTLVVVSPASAERLATMIDKPIAMRWSGGMELVAEIYGHPSGRNFPWKTWVGLLNDRLTWNWTNEIVSITGSTVRLKKPLRIAIATDSRVVFRPHPELQGIGIVGMRIEMPKHQEQPHLRELGFNAIVINQAHHCWVSDIVIHNADNGIILEGSTNTTLAHVSMTGMHMHHAFSFRSGAHDNLVEDFTIQTKVRHGLSAQDLASGNVWHRGEMSHGTFDSHRGMPFDSVRTNVRIASDGSPGGASNAGPFVGRRMVHWNIEILPQTNSTGLQWIANPEQYVSGAIVGIYGAPSTFEAIKTFVPAALPHGDKGTRTWSLGSRTEPEDLYEAQLRLRLATQAQEHAKPLSHLAEGLSTQKIASDRF